MIKNYALCLYDSAADDTGWRSAIRYETARQRRFWVEVSLFSDICGGVVATREGVSNKLVTEWLFEVIFLFELCITHRHSISIIGVPRPSFSVVYVPDAPANFISSAASAFEIRWHA